MANYTGVLGNYTGLVANCTGCALKLHRVCWEIVQSVVGNFVEYAEKLHRCARKLYRHSEKLYVMCCEIIQSVLGNFAECARKLYRLC